MKGLLKRTNMVSSQSPFQRQYCVNSSLREPGLFLAVVAACGGAEMFMSLTCHPVPLRLSSWGPARRNCGICCGPSSARRDVDARSQEGEHLTSTWSESDLYLNILPYKITAGEMYIWEIGPIPQIRVGNTPKTRGTGSEEEDIFDAKNPVWVTVRIQRL